MKKILAIISSALLLGSVANAQETFYPGWNFGIQAGVNYTAGNAAFADLLTYPTIALNAGYEFTPWFGVRGNLSGWQSKGVINANLWQDPSAIDFATGDFYKFNYVQLAADAMFDICNIFKYKSTRFCSPYVFLGVGVNYRFNNGAKDFANAFPANYAFYWTNPTFALVGRVGLGANFRISDAVKISLEVVNNLLPNHYNSVCDNANIKLGGKYFHLDQNISALLGVKFTFGQANKKHAAEAAAAAAAAEAAAAKAAADKAAREKAAAAKAAADKAAREKAEAERLAAEKAAAEAAAAKAAALAAAKAAVAEALDVKSAYPRFVIGQYSLTRDAKKKVAAAAEVLKVNPEVVVNLTGYADKETGTAAGNMVLSQKRAEAIADALTNAGVDAKQLVVKYLGDTQVPYEGAKPAEKRTVTFTVD